MEEIIKKYLDEVINLNTESAVSQRFSALINELFKSQLDFINDYFSGIETPFTIEKDDRCIRGRADNLFGNVIIEFKKTLPKNPADAKDKLPKYVYILWSREEFDARKPYLCITTDGKRFIVYSALLQDRQKIDITIDDVRLEIIDDVNWLELEDLSTAYYWLDRYFLRQEIRIPTSDTIAKDFGIESHALKTISNSLMSLWRKIREKNEYSVIINNWEKYLKIVYGNFTADEELFINHTYLATLAKLLIWSRISKEKTLPDEEQILEILEGKYFKKQGIENLIEEDFFSWLIRSEAKKAAFDSVKWLFSLLKDFDLNKLSEDVLKSLYQELVEPKSRHYLGEFYTPDWLANRIVDKFMNENPEGSFLDPSCGSGTFIYFTILEKIKRLGSSAETLNKIMDSVCGADIHPLAVIIAKTNYILALGDLLADRVRTFNIPIYLADTIKLPKMWAERTNSDYEIDINGVTAYLPVIFTQDYELGDKAIEAAKEYALRSKGLEMKYKDFKKFMENKALPVHDDHDYSQPLFTIADAFKVSIDKDEDSIWAFVLKNIYKPLSFRNKFDYIVGNPPWVVFRTLEPEYQKFVKDLIRNKYKLLRDGGHLITHMELATLFFARTADLYLKTGGKIGFVLPRSIFTSDQHNTFRRSNFKLHEDKIHNLAVEEVWDCEYVEPLFMVPSCVLFAERAKLTRIYNLKKERTKIIGKVISGRLSKKNAAKAESDKALITKDIELSLNTIGSRSFWSDSEKTLKRKVSYYKSHFFQGATIVPRNFWFVKIKETALGINPNLPWLETDTLSIRNAKPPYNEILFEGNIELPFIYYSLMSSDLIPFGQIKFCMIILPIVPKEKTYKFMNKNTLREEGFFHLMDWLEKSEHYWKLFRGSKADSLSIYERLDYYGGLRIQNPKTKYKILYNSSGTNLVSTVIENKQLDFKCKKQKVLTRGFIADCKTYFYETDKIQEALFLSSFLNSEYINRLIKPMQSRGLWGPRDICKKVLDLPIPKFNPDNEIHIKLAGIAEKCAKKVENWKEAGGPGDIKSIGKLRGIVRELLKKELDEIDKLVKIVIE